MSRNNTLLNQTWETLSIALTQIFEFHSMSQEEYMSLYNNVGRYFRSPEYNDNLLHDSLNRPNVTNKTDTTDNNQEDLNIHGGELYFRIKKFFKDHLEKIAANENNSQGEDFLRFYAKTWERYQFSSQIAHGIAAIVNSNWVRRQQTVGNKGIYDIYTTAMYIWQDIFFKEPTQSLTQTCLNLINQERNGAKVTSMLIRQVVQSYASAGFIRSERNDADSRSLSASLATYVNYFEKQFLQETEQFYKLESTNFIENNSIIAYMKKITQRIHEEENRVKDILHPTTMEKLKPMLDRVLIVDQLDRMHSEAKKLLYDEKIDDLRILFELVNRIDKANEPIQKDLEEYAHECGMRAIEDIRGVANKEPNK
jgi:cullin 1